MRQWTQRHNETVRHIETVGERTIWAEMRRSEAGGQEDNRTVCQGDVVI
jgi:hypothetical protein